MIHHAKQESFIHPSVIKSNSIFNLLDSLGILSSFLITLKINGLPFSTHYFFPLSFACFSYYFFQTSKKNLDESNIFFNHVKTYFSAWLHTVLLLTSIIYLCYFTNNYSPKLLAIWYLITPIINLFFRVLFKYFLKLTKHSKRIRKVAIAGVNPTSIEVQQAIKNSDWAGLSFSGFFDDRNEERCSKEVNSPISLKGNFNDLILLAQQGKLHLVYIVLPVFGENRVNELVTALQDTIVSIYFIPLFSHKGLLCKKWYNYKGHPIIIFSDTPFIGLSRIIKRIEDILLATTILTITTIPMLLIAITLKISSKQSVFFTQKRYGLDGREISIIKFRTLTVDEDNEKVSQVTKSDHRVTALGKLLRKTSLDELPQLFNVLIGNMSIVGPRPHPVIMNEKYRKIIQGYMIRHKVKPGITGWAQINGYRGIVNHVDEMEKRIQHDLWYIENWSFWVDLKIILKTIVRIFEDKNAW